jgi:hypothetical protein
MLALDSERSRKRMMGVLLNVLTVGAVFLLYLNWLMIGPFFSSVFWASIISVLFRSVRDWMVNQLGSFKSLESGATTTTIRNEGFVVNPAISPLSTAGLTVAPDYKHVFTSLIVSLKTPINKLILLFNMMVYPLFRTRQRQIIVVVVAATWILAVVHSLMGTKKKIYITKKICFIFFSLLLLFRGLFSKFLISGCSCFILFGWRSAGCDRPR